MNETMNHDQMKNYNILAVLRCIIENAPISKKMIMEKTGLSWGSVSTISNELVQQGLLTEVRAETGRVGRTARALDINSDDRLIVGLSITNSDFLCSVMDLRGKCVYRMQEDLESYERDEVLAQMMSVLDGVMERYAGKVYAIGVAIFGAVNTVKGVSRHSYVFKNWRNVPLRDMIMERFNIPAYVEHDCNCTAFFEVQNGLAYGMNNFVYIAASMGLGMTTVVNGNFLRGANDNAGEIGHLCMDPNGESCECGSRGCLATMASTSAVVKHVRLALEKGETPLLKQMLDDGDEELNFDLVRRAAREGDAGCRKVLEDAVRVFGRAVAMVINLNNPDLVMLSGDMAPVFKAYMPLLQDTVESFSWEYSPRNIVVVAGDRTKESEGAGLIARERLFEEQLEHSDRSLLGLSTGEV